MAKEIVIVKVWSVEFTAWLLERSEVPSLPYRTEGVVVDSLESDDGGSGSYDDWRAQGRSLGLSKEAALAAAEARWGKVPVHFPELFCTKEYIERYGTYHLDISYGRFTAAHKAAAFEGHGDWRQFCLFCARPPRVPEDALKIQANVTENGIKLFVPALAAWSESDSCQKALAPHLAEGWKGSNTQIQAIFRKAAEKMNGLHVSELMGGGEPFMPWIAQWLPHEWRNGRHADSDPAPRQDIVRGMFAELDALYATRPYIMRRK